MKDLRSVIVLLLLVVVALATPGRVTADTIDDLDLLTEHYPPKNFEKEGKVQGISTDVLLEILKMTGANKTRTDIRLLPWTEGYRAVQTRKNTMLFSMARTESRENMFKWVGPVMPTNTVVIARKDRNIRINSSDDFNMYKIGVVRDDVAQLLLLEQGVGPGCMYETISGTGGKNLGKMLAAGRIDLWAYGKIIAFWNLRESGFSPTDFEAVYTLKNSETYFALNKETDDAIIDQLQAALDELRASGKVKEIIAKYLSKL